jgi:predicted nucleic acid-binding protein
LDKIGKLDLLCKLYEEVLVPLEVREEFTGKLPSCMSIIKKEKYAKQLFIEELNLGKGEAAAITLPLETKKKKKYKILFFLREYLQIIPLAH